MAENLECPECHEPIAPDDFQCENCELLLNPQVASGEYVISDPSIVRALLSPPQRTTSREMPALPQRDRLDDAVTVRFAVPLDEDTVPYLVAGLDIALQPLHPFEAYVASFIDGMQTVAALARAAKLPEIEIKVVLKALFELHLVELHRQPVVPSVEDSLPLLNGAEFLAEEAAKAPAPEAVVPQPPPPPRVDPPLPRNPFTVTPAPVRPTPATPPPVRTSSPATPPPIAKASAGSPASRAPVSTPPPVRPSRSTPTVAPSQPPKAPPAPQERNEDFLQRAVRLEREGQVDRAIELLKRGLERSSSPAPLYNKLALILLNQRKDYLQASELLERAVELEPHNPIFQQNLLKIVGLAANTPGLHGKKSRGILDRITGRGS